MWNTIYQNIENPLLPISIVYSIILNLAFGKLMGLDRS